MTKKTLIDVLSVYPDSAEVVIINPKTLCRHDVAFITWKNSTERINIYYKDNEDGIS